MDSWRSLTGAALMLVTFAGCVSPPASEPVPSTATEVVVAETVDAKQPVSASELEPVALDERVVLRSESVGRFAREVTFRVRNPSCNGVATGSGFAISKRLLVTNRHVVEDPYFQLELSTWDGREISVAVAGISTIADLAIISTSEDLPVYASFAEDPSPGSEVIAVGYPRGDEWTATTGNVIDYSPASVFNTVHPVIRFDAPIAPGNSGGPLLDTGGNVVGVVFAVEQSGDQYSLAVPLSTLEFELERLEFVRPYSTC